MKRFYWIAAAFILLLGAGYGLFVQQQKPKSGASKRIPCQKEAVCFERTYHIGNLKTVVALLEARRYTLNSRIKKSEYMPSRLFEHVDKAQVDRMVREAIETQVSKAEASEEVLGHELTIDYMIYENDKLDPGKKTDKSKLYEGYLVFDFKLDGKTAYKFQIDFMDKNGADIPKRVACAIRSLISLDVAGGKSE